MPPQTWTIVDREQGVYLDQLALSQADVPDAKGKFSIHKRTLRGGSSDGVELIEIDNGRCTFSILPTRGMGLWRAQIHRGPAIGWRSPVGGPVHPRFVPLFDPNGLGWLEGFDELLCRCGLESNGAPQFDERGVLQYPLHGRIANLPAHKVDVSFDAASGEIVLTGVVEETRFLFHSLRLTTVVRTRLGELGLRITDEVANLSAKPAEMQLLYHVNFGQPLLDPGSKVVAPVKALVPRNGRATEGIDRWDSFGNEEPGFAEQVYFAQLQADASGMTQVLLKNAHATLGASLRFSTRQLPCFTLWKNTAAAADGYVTGLEPGTNFPNVRSFEKRQGRVVSLEPGSKAAFDLELQLHAGPGGVAKAESTIAGLQSGKPTIFREPQSGWTPA